MTWAVTDLFLPPDLPNPFIGDTYTVQSNQETFDYTNGVAYMVVSPDDAADGFGGIQVADLLTMTVTNLVTTGSMYADTAFGKPTGVPSGTISAIMVSVDGASLYLAVTDNLVFEGVFDNSAYECRLVKVDTATMTVVAEYGDGTGGPDQFPNWAVSTNVAVMTTTGGLTQRCALTTSTGRELIAFMPGQGFNNGPMIFDGSAMTYLWGGTVVNYTGAAITDAISGLTSGLLYCHIVGGQVRDDGSCDFWFVYSGYNTTSFALYKITVGNGATFTGTSTPGVTHSLIATYDIAQIFPSVVGVTNMYAGSVNYDATNNNILVFSSDILNENERLVSLSPSGTINWTIPISNAGGYADSGNTLLTGAYFGIIDYPDAELINTSTGAISASSSPSGIGIPIYTYGFNSNLNTIYAQLGGKFIRIQAVPPITPSEFALGPLAVTEMFPIDDDREVTLTWSDDAGASWANPVTQTLGQIGQFETNVQWRRLGYSRNRIYRLSWSGSLPTALLGVFVLADVAQT